ncbi:MAG: sugar ABC transporter permease [Agathobacter sp.]|uniref:carbohydrate ABC transporter permease n=1 Tax=Agathobacter sp. TaxID=2021311 RepID=UPI00258D9D35|nr:sugar ABC transporter permease [Agathobacter sp.]MCR5677694.1 sugar ABC transporter permease [Agathobacter sp.]
MKKKKSSNVVKYNRWGYIFLIPFFVTFIVFQLIPLCGTFWNSFFENYRSGRQQIGPTFIGIENFKTIITSGLIWKYARNTLIMWVLGFVPQIFFSLLLGAWFSDKRLSIKASGFFKTVIYLPNLIMASAFAMLFFTLFSEGGPVNSILVNLHILKEPFAFLNDIAATRGLVGLMNFVMWFGNTTLLLLAGMLGIDPSLYEAAEVDGATSTQKFFRITLPILKPILVYVVITSLIGGLQMFDVPSVLTNGKGNPMETSMTLIMYLNNHLYSKNFGLAGTVSVLLFLITGILSLIVFKVSNEKNVK